MSLIPELKVLDFQKSLDFYITMTGAKVLYARQENDFAMLAICGAQLMIEGFSDKSRSWVVGEMDHPFGRGMHLQIEVQDVTSLYEHFKKTDYPVYLDLEEKWYRLNDTEIGHMQFLVQDPDGYLLRFCEKIGLRTIQII